MKKRWLAACLCMLLPLCALAEEAVLALDPGDFAREREADAWDRERALRTDTQFAWHGLSSLDAETNRALKSLLTALSVRSFRQRGAAGGHWSGAVRLMDSPVLDLAVQALDGVYYEQSSLLGGETVAFTPDTFSAFVARLSVRSGDALPGNLDALFPLAMRAIGGYAQAPQVRTQAGLALSEWAEQALTAEEERRPAVHIPGHYGTSAQVISITREEIITLARVYSDILADNRALWRSAARAEHPDADTQAIRALAGEMGRALRDLPALLEAWLPAALPPIVYRQVRNEAGQSVVHQLEATLPGLAGLRLEWAPRSGGIPPLFLRLTAGERALTLVATWQDGVTNKTRREASRTDKLFLQYEYKEGDKLLEGFLTHSVSTRTTAEREEAQIRTACHILANTLLEGGGPLTLTAETSVTASGTRDAYSQRAQTVYGYAYPDGEGEDVLTVTRRTRVTDPAPPVTDPEAAVRPAGMDDAQLDAWLAGTRENIVQAVFTVLGRLPPDVAAYILDRAFTP